MTAFQIGSIVEYRERQWVVLPSEQPELLLLRPLRGGMRDLCGVLRPLSDRIGYTLPYERVKPARFPLPDPEHIGDHTAVQLMAQSARLLLRDGAAPFRSLGNLSVRPRPYQFVPLLMALRLEPVRLLIADDVGVGKTIEASLIARELLDRRVVNRLCVLCPPYLCDQWQQELGEKFNIEAVVLRSGTLSRLERGKPTDQTIFEYHPHLVASIDLVKSERYRESFLHHCPKLVIVDEVHGAAEPPGKTGAVQQQQRHKLLKDLAAKPDQHLILISATPHSGVARSFLSLLGLLRESFRALNLADLAAAEEQALARHLVQRRRSDVQLWLGEDTHFPERENEEVSYEFSPAYHTLYQGVLEFAREMIQTAETLTGWRRRMRFWSALALLRCVTSSPAAAEAALHKRADTDAPDAGFPGPSEEDLDSSFEPMVSDPLEVERVTDAPPNAVFDEQEHDSTFRESDRRHLRDFLRQAQNLRGEEDPKLLEATRTVQRLLKEGYHPILWCRYIATADYLAEELGKRLQSLYPDLKVVSVTGALSDDERRLKVEELALAPRRVLVATDCLSEGINLQEHFTAVLHYDLPWNPNRLEQREGRVDRFGQAAPRVKAVMFFGRDNPVDGAVLEVLLRRAREIHRDTGISVPVPVDSETVMEVVLQSLLRRRPLQPSLFDADVSDVLKQFHTNWQRSAEAEKRSRTRFAQHGIQPGEVEQALKETDAVLGSPQEVQSFLQEAAQRLQFSFQPQREGVWALDTGQLPPSVKLRIGPRPARWRIAFHSPTPGGATFIGRNHPLIESLAEYLFGLAMHPRPEESLVACRCGVIRTHAIDRRTTLYLLRLRYTIDSASLAEETLTWGFQGSPPEIEPLSLEEARRLLDSARPSGNLSEEEKREWLQEALNWWESLQPCLETVARERAGDLEGSYGRLEKGVGVGEITVEAYLPPDPLGVLILLPVVGGGRQ